LLNCLGHGLLADPRQVSELADLDALGGHERKDGCVRRTNLVESRAAERRVNLLGPVVMKEPKKQAN
jgi:hypothetical protein